MVPEEFIDQVNEYGNELIESMQRQIKDVIECYNFSIEEITNLYGVSYTKKQYVESISKWNKGLFSKILLIHDGKTNTLTERIYKEHQPEFRKMTITGEEE